MVVFTVIFYIVIWYTKGMSHFKMVLSDFLIFFFKKVREINLILKLNKTYFPTKHKHENKITIKSKLGVIGTYFSTSASIFAFHCRSISGLYSHSSLYFWPYTVLGRQRRYVKKLKTHDLKNLIGIKTVLAATNPPTLSVYVNYYLLLVCAVCSHTIYDRFN